MKITNRKIKLIPKLSAKDLLRFWQKVPCPNNGCHEWAGYCFKKRGGYGRFLIKEWPFFAHRVAYFLHYKIDPKEKLVCHSCDNPKCVNPAHLFLGTQKDNLQDMTRKGRHGWKLPDVRGEKHGSAKLNNHEVKAIRSLAKKKTISQKQIALIFKISPTTINNIIKNKSWTHL